MRVTKIFAPKLWRLELENNNILLSLSDKLLHTDSFYVSFILMFLLQNPHYYPAPCSHCLIPRQLLRTDSTHFFQQQIHSYPSIIGSSFYKQEIYRKCDS